MATALCRACRAELRLLIEIELAAGREIYCPTRPSNVAPNDRSRANASDATSATIQAHRDRWNAREGAKRGGPVATPLTMVLWLTRVAINCCLCRLFIVNPLKSLHPPSMLAASSESQRCDTPSLAQNHWHMQCNVNVLITSYKVSWVAVYYIVSALDPTPHTSTPLAYLRLLCEWLTAITCHSCQLW